MTTEERREEAASEYAEAKTISIWNPSHREALAEGHRAGEIHGERQAIADVAAFGRSALRRHRDDRKLQDMVGRLLDAIERGDAAGAGSEALEVQAEMTDDAMTQLAEAAEEAADLRGQLADARAECIAHLQEIGRLRARIPGASP